MRHFLSLLAFLCLGGWQVPVLSADDAIPRHFLVGVVPYNSARTLMEHHQPVLDHLRGELGAGVELVTAASFRAFFAEALRGDFDLAVMPSSLARMVQLDHGYLPVVRLKAGARGFIVVPSGSRIAAAAQLAGKTVAVPDRLAMGTIVCLEWLERHGLRPGRDFKLLEVPSFNSALLAVERGEADAAVTAPGALAQVSGDIRGRLRTVVDTGEYINLIYMAHPRVGAAIRDRLAQSLLRFSNEPAGRRFFEATGFGGYLPVTAENMRKLDPYVRETRRLLEQKAEL